MASEPTLVRLQAEFDNSPDAIAAVATLLENGASPHFVSRFRRDEIGDLGETRVFELAERLHFLDDLETRKRAIRQQAEERDQLTDALQHTLAHCFDQDLLDDIYQTFRPSRRTPGVQAREKGLGDLADRIIGKTLGDTGLPEAADQLISAENDLPTRESVLEGVLHIITEYLTSNPELRTRIRRELANGTLACRVVNEGAKNAARYKRYFDFQQPVRRVQGTHLLNIYRGERDGVLEVAISLPLDRAKTLIEQQVGLATGADPIVQQFLDLCYQHAYENMLRPACEADVRHQIKERVDRATARNLARNLRSQLMAPPLGHKKTLGIRASRNTVWLALLGEDGSVLEHLTLNLDPEDKREASLTTIAELITNQQPEGIALPHGRHQDVTSKIVQAVLAKAPGADLLVVPVDEAASAIHATSPSARKQWPGVEVGVRTAISLACRLQDSLHELLSLDPKALGLGQALDEVHQGLLTRILDETITSCVAKVGVDVNRASVDHLVRVPGMTAELARKIVDHRKQHGSFRTLESLSELLDPLTFQQSVGFLRIEGGDQPLDATAVHPEDYPIVEKIAAAESKPVSQLLGQRVHTPAAQIAGDEFGILRVKDIVHALSQHGRDVRGSLTKVRNAGVAVIDDLRPDLELQGRVTNLTEFGAFVDLGIHQDGLVHISQIPAGRLREPNRMLAVGEVITVYVLQVDPAKNRISLSMHKPRHLVEGRQATLGERMQPGAQRGPRGRRGPNREDAAQPFTRAARAPEGRRRGGMRAGPRPKSGSDDRGGGSVMGRGSRDRDRGGGRSHDGPRVTTIEAGKPIEESRGFKGELTSLSSLANLLGRGAGSVSPAESTPTTPTTPSASASAASAAPAPAEPQTTIPTPAAEVPAPAPNPTDPAAGAQRADQPTDADRSANDD
jgi:uncharacterized protein